jgi:hypothetical protein
MEPGCDCPDAMKGNDCKHEIAYDLLQAEAAAAADEEASMAWQCMIWEDQNLPMLPELPKLAKDVVNRMEADLTRTQDAIAQHGVHRTNFIQAQQDRNKAARLENALVIVNQYRSLPLCKECGSELPFCLCTQPDGPTFMNEVL